jgi:Na+-transporting methylmalonyl-CoA/oxaloacetate decarboxylase gamma subunit
VGVFVTLKLLEITMRCLGCVCHRFLSILKLVVTSTAGSSRLVCYVDSDRADEIVVVIVIIIIYLFIYC